MSSQAPNKIQPISQTHHLDIGKGVVDNLVAGDLVVEIDGLHLRLARGASREGSNVHESVVGHHVAEANPGFALLAAGVECAAVVRLSRGGALGKEGGCGNPRRDV